MDFQWQTTIAALCGATVAYVWLERYRSRSINDIPGPKSPSWVYGHTWWWQHEGLGDVEKRFLEEHGTVVRWNGALGEERLWIADPKAIHHILQDSCYQYEKPPHTRGKRELLVGKGISWVEGDAHKRHRRVMTPAFGLIEAKALYPCFTRWSNSLADKWHEAVFNAGSGQTAIINVATGLSKATLDAIGAGAFDYEFGALENTDNKFTKSYNNLGFDVSVKLSKGQIFMVDALRWAPVGFAAWIFEKSRRPGLVRLRENRAYGHEVAIKLVEERKREPNDSRKDILTLLVKANSSQRPDLRLDDEEIIAQVRTMMFAGHETTAKTLMFALWELAKNRHVQERLREEIRDTLRQIRSKGRDDFIVDDFDTMPYLLAVGKEILRFHPVGFEIQRIPMEDNVVPLTTPIVGISGKVHKELLIPAGTLVTISIVGYNMSKDMWGPGAYEFRPERWLDMNQKPDSHFGVYGNLATFSGGPRSCIGWRFAVVELNTFLVTLFRQFDFSFGEGVGEIDWTRTKTPVVVGEEHKGPQLPLKVTVLGHE